MNAVEILAPGLAAALDVTANRDAARRIATVLVRARSGSWDDPGGEASVPAFLGMRWPAGEPPGLAALCGARDLPAVRRRAALVRADPVHLRADPSRLIVFDAVTIGLDDAEADALIAEVNAAFPEQAFALERGPSASRWYATVEGVARLATPSPQSLRGRPAESCLETLREAGPLNRLMTEVQMVLSASAVNAAREADGRPPVNSIWFWGLGPAPEPGEHRFEAVVADDDVARACADACALPGFALEGGVARAAREVTGSVAVVAQTGPSGCDPAAFERTVLAPALALLAARRVDCVRLLCDGLTYDYRRHSRLLFWRAPRVAGDAPS